MPDRFERASALTGVASVALWVIGVFTLELGTDRPPGDATAEEIGTYFRDDGPGIITGTFIAGLGVLCFIWFLGIVRDWLAGAGEGPARLAATGFGAGIATAALILMSFMSNTAAAVAGEEISASAAEALWYASNAFFVAGELTGVVLAVATAAALLRGRFAPAWLAWASLVLALWLLALPIGWLGVLVGIPLWVLALSAIILRRSVPQVAPGVP